MFQSILQVQIQDLHIINLFYSENTLFKKIKEAYIHKEKKIRKTWTEFMIMLVQSSKNESKCLVAKVNLLFKRS